MPGCSPAMRNRPTLRCRLSGWGARLPAAVRIRPVGDTAEQRRDAERHAVTIDQLTLRDSGLGPLPVCLR